VTPSDASRGSWFLLTRAWGACTLQPGAGALSAQGRTLKKRLDFSDADCWGFSDADCWGESHDRLGELLEGFQAESTAPGWRLASPGMARWRRLVSRWVWSYSRSLATEESPKWGI
jgi:hypothetical protein